MSFLSGIISSVSSAFTWLDDHKVMQSVAKTTSLLNVAIPIAKMIALMIPGEADDNIVAAVEKWGVPVSLLTQQGLSGAQKVLQDGIKQKAVAELLRKQLIDIISKQGKVNWGSEVLTSVSQALELDQSALEAVALQAYRIAVEHDPEVAAVKPAPPVVPATTPAPLTVAEIEAKIAHQQARLDATTDPAQRKIFMDRIARNREELERAKKKG